MKIAILCSDITTLGGVEVVTMWLAGRFKNVYDAHVDIITCRSNNDGTINSLPNGVNILNLGIPNMQQYFRKYNYDVLEELVHKNAYDYFVVQLSTAFKNLCIIADFEIYRRIFKYTKIYLVIHESPLYFLSRYNTDYDGAFKFLLKKIYSSVKYSPTVRKFFLESAKYVKQFVTLSNGCRKELKNNFGLDSIVRYNPYEFISLEECIDDRKENIILCAGRLSKEKNLILLLSAWGKVKNHKEWKIRIVGSGDDSERLKRYVNQMKLFDVEFIGAVPHDKLMEYMQKSKVFVLPSFFEGFPTVICEAMNCKVAVITTHYDGFSDELIEDGKTGLVVDYKTENLAAKLEELINNNEKLLELQNNGYNRCKGFYTDKGSWDFFSDKVFMGQD